jgi:hypothetical protein
MATVKSSVAILLCLFATVTARSESVSSTIPPEGPWLTSVDPAPNSESMRDPVITVTFNPVENPVDVSSVQLFLGTNLLGGGFIITPVEGGIRIRYPITTDLPLGSTQAMTVVFRGQHPASVTVTSTWAFYVGPLKGRSRSLFVEAEDFNYSNDGVTGGLHANFGDPDCSLTNKAGISGIDYFQTSGHDANAVPSYRLATDVEAAKPGTDGLLRAGRTITCSYIVGWNDPGEWQNYTRIFTNNIRFNVYARLSSGGAAEAVEFALITSDPTQPNQTKQVVGEFRSSATGNWDTFHHVPLRDGCGRLISLRLSGTNTFRLAALPGNFDINYFVFVEADVEADWRDMPPEGMSITRNSNNLRLSWIWGSLQSAPSTLGPWTNHIGATSPLVITAPTGTMFFRTVCPNN